MMTQAPASQPLDFSQITPGANMDAWPTLAPELAQRLADPRMDPVARDRLRAQVSLRSRVDLVPDDFIGPRLPNQVTGGEFAGVADLFSDIRAGGTISPSRGAAVRTPRRSGTWPCATSPTS
jgi:hypothetical protein